MKWVLPGKNRRSNLPGVRNNHYLTETVLSDGIELFLRLILAHLLADFVLQPDAWVRNRFDNGWRSRCLVYHALVAGGLVFLFANLWSIILILIDPSSLPELVPDLWNTFLYAFILVTASHFVIDGLKSHRMAGLRRKGNDEGGRDVPGEDEPVRLLLIDQAAHLIVLFVVVLLLYPASLIPYPFGDAVVLIKIWIALIAFLLILWPSGILISRITRVWRTGKETTGIQAAYLPKHDLPLPAGEGGTRPGEPRESDALDKAGRLIGYLERLLIVTFILAGEYTAIGFLVAAKGLFRFNDPKKAEYVIVGTLLSFTTAVLVGAAATYLICLGGVEEIVLYLTELSRISRGG